MQWAKNDSRSTYRWLGWMLCLGIGWRVLRWSLGMPMWGDEVMLALNFLDRSWDGWLQPLDMGQVAPPLFMLLHGTLMHADLGLFGMDLTITSARVWDWCSTAVCPVCL